MIPARKWPKSRVIGATGYIGGRLVPALLEAGYQVRCLVRDARRLHQVGLPGEVGGALGVAASIGSLTRVMGPSAGGMALDVLGTWAPGVIGASISV